MCCFGRIFSRKKELKPIEVKVKKDFNIDEFNEWFKNDFDGYDGRKGAAGIFLRNDKLSSNWVEQYLLHIGHNPTWEEVGDYTMIVHKDWNLRKNRI